MKYFNDRTSPHWGKLAAASVLAIAALAGCGGGSDGAPGAAGAAGTPGAAGAPGVNANDVVKLADVTDKQWVDMKWSAQITGATIPADGKPVVNFKVVDENGKPITGLAYSSLTPVSTATAAAYANFGFTVAKLMPAVNGSPSYWLSYIVTSTPTFKSATDHSTGTTPAAQRSPTIDNQGVMTDLGNGAYSYKFYRDITQAKTVVDAGTYDGVKTVKADLGDVSYAPAQTHRVAMQFQGAKPGTGTNTPDGFTVKATVSSTNPVAAYLDFRPDGAAVTATRTITKVDVCQSCHAGALLHGRKDPNLCVTCHTPQSAYGYAAPTAASFDANGDYVLGSTGATVGDIATKTVDGTNIYSNVDMPRWVHKIHMGESLVKKNYNIRGVTVNETRYPQDVRNCVKCHDGSATSKIAQPNGDNWKTAPSIKACGSCHDGINFATGTGKTVSGITNYNGQGYAHGAGKAYANDADCATCHKAQDVVDYHVPVAPIAAAILAQAPGTVATGNTNAAAIAAYTQHLPAGAKAFTYELGNVTVTSGKVAVQFRMLDSAGVPVTFNTYAAGVTTEMLNGFVGSPSIYVRFAVPQDGMTVAPTDFNANLSGYLKNIWNGTATTTGAGTLSARDANGYYTVTLTGATIPTTAKMVTAGVGYTYALPATQPLTQIDLPLFPYNKTTLIGGLIVPAPNVWKVATGYTSRRVLVENERCNTCHEKLGVFGESAYHSGQRNDAQSCNFCHNPNQSSGGWSAASSSFVHGIHGAGKRSQPFYWHAVDAVDNFANVGYPGGISKCEACHLPNTVNSGAIYRRAVNNAVTPVSSTIVNSTSSTASIASFNAEFDNRLYVTVASGTIASTSTSAPFLPTVYGVAADTAYGTASPAYTAATGVVSSQPANLVNSPTAAACFSCHDTAKARAHMEDSQSGGSIYKPRAAAQAKIELCSLCHSAGKVADAAVVHQ